MACLCARPFLGLPLGPCASLGVMDASRALFPTQALGLVAPSSGCSHLFSHRTQARSACLRERLLLRAAVRSLSRVPREPYQEVMSF